MVGTTLAITTPSTTLSPKPRSSKSCRSSIAISSAVRSRRELTRQSATRRSPSNRASVTFVLPTSTANSTGNPNSSSEVAGGVLLSSGGGGGLSADRRCPPCHPPGVRSSWEVPLAERNPRIPGHVEAAFQHLAADRLMRPAEGDSRSHQRLGRVGRQKGGVRRRGGQPLAVELEVLDE